MLVGIGSIGWLAAMRSAATRRPPWRGPGPMAVPHRHHRARPPDELVQWWSLAFRGDRGSEILSLGREPGRGLRELPKRSSRGRWPAEAFCLAPIPVIRSARSAPPNRGSPACPSGLELDDQPSSRTTSLQPPMSVGRPFRRIDLCHTKRDFAGLYLLPEPI